MDSVTTAATFTLIGSAIGAGITIYIQLIMRREKFKEILYKERLPVYADIVKQVSEITFMAGQFEQQIQGQKNIFKMDKLVRQVLCFDDTTRSAEYLISKEAFEFCCDFLTALNSLGREIAKNPTSINTALERIHGSAIDVINAIRADLGVDKLSKSIQTTIDTAFIPK